VSIVATSAACRRSFAIAEPPGWPACASIGGQIFNLLVTNIISVLIYIYPIRIIDFFIVESFNTEANRTRRAPVNFL